MTAFLGIALCFFGAFALYIAAASRRAESEPQDYLNGGGRLPAWSYIFAATGVAVASLGLQDHLRLTATYGLQYSHVALGFVLVALCSVLVQKRVWLAARLTGSRTLGDLMGDHFGSIALRFFLFAVLLLFAVPVAALLLNQAGELIAVSTNGTLAVGPAIWLTGFFLFLVSAIGGWRATIYVVAAQSLLMVLLLAFDGVVVGTLFDSSAGIQVADGVLADRIPGVIQFTDGIGKELPQGGIWTSVAILSFGLSMIGIVLNPAFIFLGITTEARRGFAFNQVWMTPGLLAGLLLVVGPLFAVHLGGQDAGLPNAHAFVEKLATIDQALAVTVLMLVLSVAQLGVVFFTASGANIITIEVTKRFVLPGLAGRGEKLAARIALAVIYMAVAMLATFAPVVASIFSSLALSLSAQLLPAFLGLCWLPWMSRNAVLSGLILGFLTVIFTEPVGLILFEGLFIDLPWGRWPLTVHSAGWGLFINLAACLLVSIFTHAGSERDQRQKLHDAFFRNHRTALGGGRAARTAKWSLVLLWAFLALGPGAILGNTFFSQPILSGVEVVLGVPSLLVWQLFFWLCGVPLVWWLAYPSHMSIVDVQPEQVVVLAEEKNPLFVPTTAPWIERVLDRVAHR